MAQVKKKKAPPDGIALVIKGGQGFIMARGVDQPDDFEVGDGPFVEVGPKHTIAFKITQADALDAAIVMLAGAGSHLKGCIEHQEALMRVLEELGIVKITGSPK